MNSKQTEPADGLPTIRQILDRTGHRPRKAWGQNFIRDLNYTRQIVERAGPVEGLSVLEIGPGPGGLTRALLLAGAARVIAIERDPRCLEALAEISQRWPGKLEVVNADACKIDMSEWAKEEKLKIVANLPYGIAAPLLVSWLEVSRWLPWWSDATIMLQREMAERLTATPATPAFGRLSVLAQWRCRCKIVMQVPPQVFVPPPKVESRLVKLSPLAIPDPAFEMETLTRLTRTAFGGRRKMLRRSLASLVEHPDALLEAAGIIPTLRADALSVEGFCALAEELQKQPPSQD